MPDTNRPPSKDLLDWLGFRSAPDFTRSRAFGGLVGFLLTALILLAFATAVLVLLRTMGQAASSGAEGPNLGAGALITALLGGPFLVWGTWLKHRTVRLQQEGHMTDRISKAVEQLGAEKKVDRIGRSVTIWTGPVRETVITVPGTEAPMPPARSRESARRHTMIQDGDDDVEGTSITFQVWRGERVEIQYLGQPIALGDEDTIGSEGEWKVLSETLPNIEVRIGAILSLERIAQDSTTHDKGRDHVRVMEVLCAYVRANAPGSSARKSLRETYEEMREGTEDAPGLTDEQISERYGFDFVDKAADVEHLRIWAADLPSPRSDVALALRVIGRRTAQQRQVEAAWPDEPDEATVWSFDLPCPQFPRAYGETAPLKEEVENFLTKLQEWKKRIDAYKGYRLDLRGTNLQGANLAANRPDASDAVFGGVLLDDARMEGASLQRARIGGAKLRDARMEGAKLSLARMEGAVLPRVRMEGATLFRANMAGAVFAGSRLEGAVFSRARLEGANLSHSHMDGAALPRVSMVGADVRFALMKGTDLANARMAGTDLGWAQIKGASVQGVDLSALKVSQAQVDSAFGDASVRLPSGIARPDHWPDWILPITGAKAFDREWQKWRNDPKGYVPPPAPQKA